MSDVTTRRVRSIALGTVLGLVLGIALVANASAGASTRHRGESTTLRLGYFDNVTHAPALVGLEEGFFEDALGNTTLETSIFNAGPTTVTALLSDSLDVTYIGPNPTVSAFQQSDGAVQVISGVASGGAYLVVKPDIKKPKDLEGTTIATPQLGNTQDVALRSYLKKKGFDTDTAGGGDVSILPAGQRASRSRPSRTTRSRAHGCRSHGRPASSTREAARCSWTSATCGRTART